MITFSGFIIGLLIMVASFFLVRYGDRIEMSIGSFSWLVGFKSSSWNWLNWKTLGLFGLAFGFIIAFGLLQEFFALTLGRLVNFSQFGGN